MTPVITASRLPPQGVIGAFMSGLIKYFPETDWFEEKQKLRRTYKEVGCLTSYGFGDF